MATSTATALDSTPAAPARMRILHGLYSRGTALNFWIARRLGPVGMAMCLLIITSSVLAMSQPRDSAYQLFSMTVALSGLGLIWAFSRGAKIEVVRHVPQHATAGVPLRYHIEVRNCGKSSVAGAILAETAADPRPSYAQFCREREPGEDERNAFDRFFAYYRWHWLVTRRRTFDGGRAINTVKLGPMESRRVAIEITPLRRGVIPLHDMRVLLPDPIGMFQKCRRVSCPQNSLIVLPRRYRLPPIELPGGATYRIGSDANTNSIGTHGEFVGLRDYRAGDPLRLIHWKSWARTGRPIVKELEDTHYPRHALVIDNFAGGTQDAAFEELVSVAASFATGIDTRESLLDLMFVEGRAHQVTVGRGVERAEKLLEVLAGVSLSEDDGFAQLSKIVKSHVNDLGSCVVILLGWDAKRAAFLADLSRSGLICVPVVIGFGDKPTGCPGHWIDAAHPERDLARLPIHPAH